MEERETCLVHNSESCWGMLKGRRLVLFMIRNSYEIMPCRVTGYFSLKYIEANVPLQFVPTVSWRGFLVDL